MRVNNLEAAIILLFPFLIRSTAAVSQQDSPENTKYYAIKSARITYVFYNGLQEGEKTLIFDDWGNYEKLTQRIRTKNIGSTDTIFQKMAGKEVRELYLKTPESIYSVDLDDRTGTEVPHKTNALTALLMGDSSRKVKVGTDTLLGKLCDVYIIDKVNKIWLWQGLALKQELLAKVDGFLIGEVATSVDETYVIGADEFILKGIKIRKYP